jgi:hypothetical protein
MLEKFLNQDIRIIFMSFVLTFIELCVTYETMIQCGILLVFGELSKRQNFPINYLSKKIINDRKLLIILKQG